MGIAVARDEVAMDTAVSGRDNRVGQRRELRRDIGKRAEPQHVANQDAQNLLPPESRIRPRVQAGGLFVQTRAIFIGRPHPVQVAVEKELFEPLRRIQNLLGQEIALRKNSDQVLQRRRGVRDPLKRSGLPLFEARQSGANARRIGRMGREQFNAVQDRGRKRHFALLE